MNIEQLISPEVPTLQPTDSGSKVLQLMEDTNLTQLPLLTGDTYTALIKENDLLEWDTPESPLSAAGFLQYKPALFAGAHPYEALRLTHQQSLTVLPVIGEGQQYLGAITHESLLKYITANSGLETPGGIIVLSMPPRSYSLAEIARICENEDVTILSSQMRNDATNGAIEVTLKTNRTNLDALVQAFERYEYDIKEVHGDQQGAEDIMERYRLLMNFINM